MINREITIKHLIKSSVILISLLLIQSCASVKLNYDNLFSKIATYDYGQDRTNLTDLAAKISLFSQKEETRAIVEEDLLSFLKTDATFASKQFVCRQLRLVGSENSISALTDLLEADKTTDIAKYALENIHGEFIDEKLVDLIPDASKKVKLGIINTLGVRRSKIAVQTLGELLNSNDSDIAIASASTLGKIATNKCLPYLETKLNSKNTSLKNVVSDSYLLCIDALANKGSKTEVNQFYNNLYSQNVPLNIKEAALVGIINTSSNKEMEILERIKSVHSELKFIPISKIRELPNNTDLTKFAKLLPTLEPANQIQLISVFEDRSDKSVKQYVLESLKSDDLLVRIVALRTLSNIGDQTDVIRLAKIASNTNGDEKYYAERALDLLNAREVDNTIVDNLSTPGNEITAELIRTVGTRSIKSAFSDIIKFINNDNRLIRNETFKTLSLITSNKDLPSLFDILLKGKDISNKKKIERTISKILINYPSKKNSDILIDKYKLSNDKSNKTSTLRLLGFTSEADALNLLRNETINTDDEIRLAATVGLSNWSTADPLRDLEQIMVTTSNNTIKSAAYKGFIKFIGLDSKLTNKEKVALYQIALNNAANSNERNFALDGIGHTDCFESLEAVKPFINQTDVKQTVDDAINRVSWHLHKQDPKRVKEYVNWFLSKIKDEHFQTKNKFLLDVIDKFIKNRDANLR